VGLQVHDVGGFMESAQGGDIPVRPDNLAVTAKGHENLTREAFHGLRQDRDTAIPPL
jgi:hypothetical protein